jgi:hypothetical protein
VHAWLMTLIAGTVFHGQKRHAGDSKSANQLLGRDSRRSTRKGECKIMQQKKEIVPMAEAEVRRYMAMFGPPPVLSTEDPKAFEELSLNLVRCHKPRDFQSFLFVWEIAVDTWNVRRCTLHGTITIDRSLRARTENQVTAERQMKAQYEKALRDKAKKYSQSPRDVAELAALQEMVDNRAARIDAILDRQPNDIDINIAFRGSVKFLHDLDHLHNSADRRRYGKYVLLEKHGAVLDRSAQETDKVVDAEFQEVEAETVGLPQVTTAAEINEATDTQTEVATTEATDTQMEAATTEVTDTQTEVATTEATDTQMVAAATEATDTQTEAEIEEETRLSTEDQPKIPSAPSMIPEESENSNDVEPQSRIESTQ